MKITHLLTFVVFMVVVLLLQTHVQSIKIVIFSSSLAAAAKLDIKHFPGRNSGLHRRPHATDLPPLCKLQAGLKLLNISLAASLVVLAGDVSLNPGPTKCVPLCVERIKRPCNATNAIAGFMRNART